MILQFAHHLAKKWELEKGVVAPEVYAQNACSLNFREFAPQIDRRVDLTTIGRGGSMNDYVLPLKEELPGRIIGWSRVSSGG